MPERIDRLEREVAAAFRDLLAPQPGDEAKLAAMLEVALRPPPGGAPPSSAAAPTRLWPRLVGVGGVVVAAVVVLATGREPTPMRVSEEVPAGSVVFVEDEAPVLADEIVAPPEVEPGPVAPVPVVRSTVKQRLRASDSSTSVAVVLEDPDALLRAANQARRARAFAEADRLYTDLQVRFPESRAARTSRVPHARLLLDTLDRPAEALDAFAAYLAADPRGTLSEEALVGQAQALGRLGREADARDAWRSLLGRFPESVHAPTAHSRIAEVRP